MWFTEKHTPHAGLTMEVRETVYRAASPYQTIEILDTFEFGRMLLLDGLVMLTERDEFIYHEMLAHVPLNTHPDPGKVLVIGGGDGGTVREALKHGGVEEITVVEIDEKVVEAALRFLPGISEGLRDPRTRVVFGDGVRFVAQSPPGSFDVILVDSTDPVGPAEALFTEDFFRNCASALSPGGIMVCQSESPFYHMPFLTRVYSRVVNAFGRAAFYLAPIPTYPGGTWSFLMGFLDESRDLPPPRDHQELSTRYYDSGVHAASFAVPRYMSEALRR